MSFSIVSPTASVRMRRDKYAWSSGPASGPHTVWFPKLSEALRALEEAPSREAMPVRILEIRGRKPKGKWVWIVIGVNVKKPWYLAKVGTELKVQMTDPENVIRANVQHFASLPAAQEAMRILPERLRSSAQWLRVYI